MNADWQEWFSLFFQTIYGWVVISFFLIVGVIFLLTFMEDATGGGKAFLFTTCYILLMCTIISLEIFCMGIKTTNENWVLCYILMPVLGPPLGIFLKIFQKLK